MTPPAQVELCPQCRRGVVTHYLGLGFQGWCYSCGYRGDGVAYVKVEVTGE